MHDAKQRAIKLWIIGAIALALSYFLDAVYPESKNPSVYWTLTYCLLAVVAVCFLTAGWMMKKAPKGTNPNV